VEKIEMMKMLKELGLVAMQMHLVVALASRAEMFDVLTISHMVAEEL